MSENIDAANAAKAPQQSDPAHTLEGPKPSTLKHGPSVACISSSIATMLEEPPVFTGKPTLHGPPPPGMERRFAPPPPGVMPEWAKLPAPRERCPISGASRSWLLDQEALGRIKIVRVRQPGRLRGACFVFVPSLLALLRGELEKPSGTAAEENVKGGKEGAS